MKVRYLALFLAVLTITSAVTNKKLLRRISMTADDNHDGPKNTIKQAASNVKNDLAHLQNGTHHEESHEGSIKSTIKRVGDEIHSEVTHHLNGEGHNEEESHEGSHHAAKLHRRHASHDDGTRRSDSHDDTRHEESHEDSRREGLHGLKSKVRRASQNGTHLSDLHNGTHSEESHEGSHRERPQGDSNHTGLDSIIDGARQRLGNNTQSPPVQNFIETSSDSHDLQNTVKQAVSNIKNGLAHLQNGTHHEESHEGSIKSTIKRVGDEIHSEVSHHFNGEGHNEEESHEGSHHAAKLHRRRASHDDGARRSDSHDGAHHEESHEDSRREGLHGLKSKVRRASQNGTHLSDLHNGTHSEESHEGSHHEGPQGDGNHTGLDSIKSAVQSLGDEIHSAAAQN